MRAVQDPPRHPHTSISKRRVAALFGGLKEVASSPEDTWCTLKGELGLPGLATAFGTKLAYFAKYDCTARPPHGPLRRKRRDRPTLSTGVTGGKTGRYTNRVGPSAGLVELPLPAPEALSSVTPMRAVLGFRGIWPVVQNPCLRPRPRLYC